MHASPHERHRGTALLATFAAGRSPVLCAARTVPHRQAPRPACPPRTIGERPVDINDLTGKIAIVTGGSNGIGAATVRMLAEAGASVHVGYNKGAERAEKLIAVPAGQRTPRGQHRAGGFLDHAAARRGDRQGARPPRHPGQFRRLHQADLAQKSRRPRRRLLRCDDGRQCARPLRHDPHLRAAAEGERQRHRRQRLLDFRLHRLRQRASSTAPPRRRSTP